MTFTFLGFGIRKARFKFLESLTSVPPQPAMNNPNADFPTHSSVFIHVDWCN
jgi:hypothetical protein